MGSSYANARVLVQILLNVFARLELTQEVRILVCVTADGHVKDVLSLLVSRDAAGASEKIIHLYVVGHSFVRPHVAFAIAMIKGTV